jgi:hypothetical protein
MAYNREVISIQNDIQAAWQGVLACIRQMHPSSQIRPNSAIDVFVPDATSQQVKFDVRPVVFHIPERANTSESNLYVAISGWLTFGGPMPADSRRTTLRFGTQVGYFREKNGRLDHIYGVHYDMDDELPGHPVFHAQMSSQADFRTSITGLFHSEFDSFEDLTAGLLRNVRTPTAQMDVFSVIIQLGADHLVSEVSGPEVHDAFARLREACDFFMGAAGRFPYLNSHPATHCYRSTHWYKRDAEQVA